MRRLLIVIPAVIFAVLFVFLVAMTLRGEKQPTQSHLISAAAPAFALSALGDETIVSLTDFKGRPVVVNFFASWCTPCRGEHPVLMDLAAQNYTIIGINYKDTPELAQAFIDELGNPFTAIGQDKSGRTGIDFGITGVPETFILGPDGSIIEGWAGPLDQRVLAKKIMPALQAAEAATRFSGVDAAGG